jgi:hypothetical protein
MDGNMKKTYANPGSMDENMGKTYANPGRMDKNMGTAYPKSGRMEKYMGTVYPKSGRMEKYMGTVYPKSGRMDENMGTAYPKPGRMEKNMGTVYPNYHNFNPPPNLSISFSRKRFSFCLSAARFDTPRQPYPWTGHVSPPSREGIALPGTPRGTSSSFWAAYAIFIPSREGWQCRVQRH